MPSVINVALTFAFYCLAPAYMKQLLIKSSISNNQHQAWHLSARLCGAALTLRIGTCSWDRQWIPAAECSVPLHRNIHLW